MYNQIIYMKLVFLVLDQLRVKNAMVPINVLYRGHGLPHHFFSSGASVGHVLDTRNGNKRTET